MFEQRAGCRIKFPSPPCLTDKISVNFTHTFQEFSVRNIRFEINHDLGRLHCTETGAKSVDGATFKSVASDDKFTVAVVCVGTKSNIFDRHTLSLSDDGFWPVGFPATVCWRERLDTDPALFEVLYPV